MAKIKAYDINGSEGQTSEVISPATTTATTTELAAPQSATLGTIAGEIESDDIVIPRLNLVQNVGSLAELFNGGDLVLNKEVVLSAPLELTILSARKQFVQNLDFDSDEKPQVYNTLEEVHAAGGTIEWVGNQKPSFTPVLHVNLVFKAPAGLDYALPLEYNGDAYGLAVWTLRGVAYTRAGKNILTAAKFALRDGLFNGKWELTSKREKFGRNSVFVPVLRNVGRNTPDFVNYLRTIG